MRARCEIFLLEHAFCSDSSYHSKLTDKHRQHVVLKAALEEAGWVVVGGLRVLLFGNSGTVFHPTQEILESLGVLPADALRCLRTIHVSGVNSCHSIVRDRRRLEHDVEGVALGLDDPP